MILFRRARLIAGLTRYAQGKGDLPDEVRKGAESDPALAALVDEIGPSDGPAKEAVPWALILQIIMAIVEILTGGKTP